MAPKTSKPPTPVDDNVRERFRKELEAKIADAEAEIESLNKRDGPLNFRESLTLQQTFDQKQVAATSVCYKLWSPLAGYLALSTRGH